MCSSDLNVLADYADTLKSIDDLSQSIMEIFTEDKLLPGFKNVSLEITKQSKLLSLQSNLLDMIRSHNLNPSQILRGKNLGDMTGQELSEAIFAGATAVNRLAQERMRIEAQEAQRLYNLNQVGTLFGDQVARMADLASKPMTFFQGMRFELFQKQFDALTDRMAIERDNYMKTGAATTLATLNQLTDQREGLLSQIKTYSDHIGQDQVRNNALAGVFNQQLQMLDQLKSLGWDLPSFYWAYFNNVDQLSAEALARQANLEDSIAKATVSQLQKQVAEKALLSTLDTNWNVSGMAKSFVDMYSDKVMKPLLDNLKAVVLMDDKRNQALYAYNNGWALCRA